MTREELENEIFISVIRDLLFFLFVNRARGPPLYDPLVEYLRINMFTGGMPFQHHSTSGFERSV